MLSILHPLSGCTPTFCIEPNKEGVLPMRSASGATPPTGLIQRRFAVGLTDDKEAR